ncbi:MAG: hypothetical protein IKS49_07525 [Actinomycetaceae bacterium]|nr:hypothetical protein [Actinomycetaceae bacterium]
MHPHRFTRTQHSFATLLVLVLILPLTLTLSACEKGYTQSDVEEYVRSEMGIEEFTVAAEPAEKKRAGASYKSWTVTTDWYGLDEPITFDVEEYEYGDLPEMTHRLLTRLLAECTIPREN